MIGLLAMALMAPTVAAEPLLPAADCAAYEALGRRSQVATFYPELITPPAVEPPPPGPRKDVPQPPWIASGADYREAQLTAQEGGALHCNWSKGIRLTTQTRRSFMAFSRVHWDVTGRHGLVFVVDVARYRFIPGRNRPDWWFGYGREMVCALDREESGVTVTGCFAWR